MQRTGYLYRIAPFTVSKNHIQPYSIYPYIAPTFLLDKSHARYCNVRANILSVTKLPRLNFVKIRSVFNEGHGKLSEDDDELCPVDCVKEFKTDEEFLGILEKAKDTGSLVVVDFYRTSCGSCKYIEQGFLKLCKGSGNLGAQVMFLKHNVIDEYDEESEVADRLRIRSVPLFHFYKDGVLLEAFATRDKARIDTAIHKYTSASQDL